MIQRNLSCAVVGAIAVVTSTQGQIVDGQGQNQTADHGYYYMVTGGKFPTGNTPNGDNGSGGTIRFFLDDPAWSRPLGWHKDDWFTDTAGFALTMKNSGAIIYDNNGLEDGSHGDFYDATGLANSADKPGLYRGYSMSNNFDWIYASYFLVEQEMIVDEIIGYFDAAEGFDPSDPYIGYRMNIFSSFQEGPTTWMPTGNSFVGDVLSSDTTSGSLTWSDTGVNRVFGDDMGNATDDIFRLTFSLDTPLTLDPGVYFFSHDAMIIPEPHTIGTLGCGLLVAVCVIRRRRKK